MKSVESYLSFAFKNDIRIQKCKITRSEPFKRLQPIMYSFFETHCIIQNTFKYRKVIIKFNYRYLCSTLFALTMQIFGLHAVASSNAFEEALDLIIPESPRKVYVLAFVNLITILKS